MNWVTEKEEWLVDWCDARRLKQIAFESVGGADQLNPADPDPYVFFSEVIQAGERCFVCRADGCIVDIFDISPLSEFLAVWRIQLPSPLVADVGIAHASSSSTVGVQGAHSSISIVLLTKAHTIHRVQILLNLPEPDVVKRSSTACSLPSKPSSFCALDEDFVAVGCYDGTLHAFRLNQGSGVFDSRCRAEYEFTDSSYFQRIIAGWVQPTPPRVLALAFLGHGRGNVFSAGFRLLCFSMDGQLRLWEAQETRSRLVSNVLISSSIPHSVVDAAGTSMKVNPSKTRACLVLGPAVYLIDIPVAGAAQSLTAHVVDPPFTGASPSLVTLSDSTLWSFWGGHSREQLFYCNLGGEHNEGRMWHARALDSNQANSFGMEVQNVVTEGCEGRCAERAPQHKIVFTLFQQQDVWRAEEDGFDVLQLAETLEHRKRHVQSMQQAEPADIGASFNDQLDHTLSIEDLVMRWWVNRIFLPGRYSSSVIASAIKKMSDTLPHEEPGIASPEDSRSILEALLRRHTAAQMRKVVSMEPFNWQPHKHQEVVKSPLDTAVVIAHAARAFLGLCDELWRRRHQVCGLGLSTLWSQHCWFPAGSLAEEQGVAEARLNACPMLLCHGGISCIRAVHSWSERWWVTLHLSHDLSNYERMELDDVLRFSNMDEWKLCATAWFLAQCIGNSKLAFAISLSHRHTKPSASLLHFKEDVPTHLAAHVKRCLECRSAPDWAHSGALGTIKRVVDGICDPDDQQVQIMHRTLAPLRGAWFGEQGGALQAHAASWQGPDMCLSDLLRGNIAVSECEYTCTAMRDMLLLCVYAAEVESVGQISAPDRTFWIDLMDTLDERLPTYSSLHSSMRLELQRPAASTVYPVFTGQRSAENIFTVCGCHLWASMYRMVWHGTSWSLRPPLASFRSFQYAMQLLRCNGWDALRWWSRCQHLRAFISFLAGCEFVATKHFAAAHEAFVHAEGIADVLTDCLRHAGLFLADAALKANAGAPALIAYCAHLSKLFECNGDQSSQYFFLKRAAELADESTGNALGQMLWASAFGKAVEMENWTDALKMLVHIDDFKPHLRILGQKLRSTGRIELMLQLPDKHRMFFEDHLRQHASTSTPIAGSDSLACYNLLYALQFTGQEYLKAATTAYTLYCELRRPLEDSMGIDPRSTGSESLSWFRRGDCNSNPCEVPRLSSLLSAEVGASRLPGVTPCKAIDQAWPLLEQQRNALLMLISALSLSPGKLLVMTPQQASDSNMMDTSEPGTNSAADYASANLSTLKDWFSNAAGGTDKDSVISLVEAEKLLAAVEAYMVCSGSSGRSDFCSPAHAARTVAGLGLLGLALQVASSHELDLWQFAFQPFTQLCVEAEQNQESDKVARLASAAAGPTQAYMFVKSDGREPLCQNGDMCSALWQTLEQGLLAVNRLLQPAVGAATGAAVGPAANCARLYSLVADEVLSLRSGQGLPRFLVSVLSTGLSWVSLLRLYMRHSCVEDAVELLAEQLKHCQSAVQRGERCLVLQDFPVSLVVQLRNGICDQLGKKTGCSAETLQSLDGILTQFQNLLQDSEHHGNLSS